MFIMITEYEFELEKIMRIIQSYEKKNFIHVPALKIHLRKMLSTKTLIYKHTLDSL